MATPTLKTLWLGRTLAASALALYFVALGPGCSNATGVKSKGVTAGTGTTSGSTDTFKIANVSLGSSGSSSATSTSATAPTSVTLFFDSAKSTAAVTDYCSTSSSSTSTKGCLCQFTWSEVNKNSGASVPVPRTVTTAISNVQAALVSCALPSVYSTEISTGTTLKVTVIPSASSTVSFTVPAYTFTKSDTITAGSFQDEQGRSFDNIHRYACYDQFKRGMKVASRMIAQTNSANGETIKYPLASQFCVATVNGNAGGTGCDSLPPAENSAQSYYYNLFIRNSDRGGVNASNSRYICPLVKESLDGSTTVGQQNKFWPMDTSFALAVNKSADFAVGVEAISKLVGDPSDPSSQNSSCDASSNSSGNGSTTNTSGLVKSCLGFAARPAADGTCSYIKDSSGQLRMTYRLRRYVAVYPAIFDTNGKALQQAQATDTIYVLDRPLYSASANPLKPYTMLGPKPCPFAYFDNKGVVPTDPAIAAAYPTTGYPSYVATNNAAWNGTNVDGIEFPNFDANQSSCAAVLPVYKRETNMLGLGTLHSTNPAMRRKYVRPIRAWAPHYEEDTSFEACAPESAPRQDPPMHFSKDSNGNVSWCAEVYPSQNDAVGQLDKVQVTGGNYPGLVLPFTSHVTKNSASAECTFTLPSTVVGLSGYGSELAPAAACPAAGGGAMGRVAWHPGDLVLDQDKSGTNICSKKTCDRTVSSAGLTWPRFPLLARAAQTEAAIVSDSSYNCTVTYDGGGSKTGKTTPTQGCCGPNSQVWTGAAAAAPNNAQNAHLEPDAACLVPTY